jgi:hypothetical protein
VAGEVIVFPDTEDLLVTFLAARLRARGYDIPVTDAVPDQRPEAFVVVTRHGGTRRNIVVDQPTIGVECWHTADKPAHDLAQLVRALIHSLRGSGELGVAVYRVQEFAGPANLPDPVSAQPRYTFTVSIDVRGRAAEKEPLIG